MDRVFDYCSGVLSGEIRAGKSVKWAVNRHLNELALSTGDDFPYRFDTEKAQEIIDFCETLTLAEGNEPRPLKLYPFQDFILGSLFGWVHKTTGYRRFRSSYTQIARQQGKSLLSGAISTFIGNFSGYMHGLILFSATKQAQAKIVFDEVVKFIGADPDLASLFKVMDYKSEIECLITKTKMLAVGRDTKSLDGFRANYVSVDEYHAHRDNQMYKLGKSGQKHLKEALIGVITTAGFFLEGPCHKLYRDCKDILVGNATGHTQFVFIAELDEGDDLDDVQNWYKTSPALQYNPHVLETLIDDYAQAKRMGGGDWVDFLTKNLNMWVEFTESKYMSMTAWYKCASKKTLESFRGADFILGLDLSSGGDLTSVVFEFTWTEGNEKKYFVHQHSFMPLMRVEEHEITDNVPYKMWAKKGFLTITTALGGIKTDYRKVFEYIRDNIARYNLKLKTICYDPANASAFLNDLEDFGVDCFDIYQNSKSLNDPTMDIKYEVEAGNVEYNAEDELLSWAINNCQLTEPKNGNVMLDKNSRFNRIDPVAAWVDAHKFSIRNDPKPVELTDDYIKNFYARGDEL